MTSTFSENRLSMMKPFWSPPTPPLLPQAPSKHQTELSANIRRFDPGSNILWRILEFSTADYRVGRGLELWKGQRRVYSSSSSSLFSYLWRMSCKGGNFKSWSKLGQAGSDLPQFPLVLGLPYVVCQGVKSSFKLQWKWITTCACVACAEVLKKGSRMPLIPQ